MFRVFSFMGQVFGMVGRKPGLLAPLVLNIAAAVPLHILFVLASYLVPAQYGHLVDYALMLLGCTALYFIDYFCAGLNTSLVAEQVTTGQASLGTAFSRTLRASPSILVFAIVTAIFDLLVQIANSRRGMIRTMLLGIIRTVWTTATYVMMPAMVLDRLGFVDSFKRSKQLMENDPTQVGVGVVALGLVTWVMGLAAFMAANYIGFGVLAAYPMVGMIFALFVINVSWAVSSYLKSTYYTCYYLWVSECLRQQRAGVDLAPAPLRDALGGIQPGMGYFG